MNTFASEKGSWWLTIIWPSGVVGSERWHKGLLKNIFELYKPDCSISCYLSIYPYWTYGILWKLWILWKCWHNNIAFILSWGTRCLQTLSILYIKYNSTQVYKVNSYGYLSSASLIVCYLLSFVSDLVSWWRWDSW